MRVGKFIICFIASVFMYIWAPQQIDFSYTVFSVLLFLIQSFWILKDDIKKDGLLFFNALFLLSYFFVSYAFPLFVLGTPLQSFFVGIFDYIDYNVSTRCSALCTMAISAYFVAYESQRYHKIDFSKWIKTKSLNGLKPIYLLTFVVLLVKTIIYMRDTGGIAVDSGFWELLYEVTFCIYLGYNCSKHQCRTLKEYIKINKLPLYTCLFIMLVYFVIGDRGIIITCGVIMVGVYWYSVKRIKTWLLLLGMVVGVFLMFVLQVTRKSDASLGSGNTSGFVTEAETALAETSSPIMMFSDFLIIHRELYLGYEYYQKNGVSYPSQIFILPFYPLPFFPTLLSEIAYGKTMNEIKPGVLLNNYIAYTGYGHLGIHCVSDLLMRFGYIGLILFFYLWGYVVARVSASKGTGILGYSLFVILLSQAIYVPRAPILDQIKILTDVFIVLWVASVLFKKNRG